MCEGVVGEQILGAGHAQK